MCSFPLTYVIVSTHRDPLSPGNVSAKKRKLPLLENAEQLYIDGDIRVEGRTEGESNKRRKNQRNGTTENRFYRVKLNGVWTGFRILEKIVNLYRIRNFRRLLSLNRWFSAYFTPIFGDTTPNSSTYLRSRLQRYHYPCILGEAPHKLPFVSVHMCHWRGLCFEQYRCPTSMRLALSFVGQHFIAWWPSLTSLSRPNDHLLFYILFYFCST